MAENANVEETPVNTEVQGNNNTNEAQAIEIVTDPIEKLAILQELEVLSKLINTSYYLPKYNETKRNQDPRAAHKIISSVQLNYFSGQQMKQWGERIIYLTERIGA